MRCIIVRKAEAEGDEQVAISPRARGTSPGALLGKIGDANTWLVIIVLK